jgi:hypothetical protein
MLGMDMDRRTDGSKNSQKYGQTDGQMNRYNAFCHYYACRYADCLLLFIVMLYVIMLGNFLWKDRQMGQNIVRNMDRQMVR